MPSSKTDSLALFICLICLTTTAQSAELTSTDLYCETFITALIEHSLDYKPPSTPEQAKDIEKSEPAMLEYCKAMPVTGAAKKQKDMTPEEMAQISCIAIAEGISTASTSSTEKRPLYSKITKDRLFFNNACMSNKQKFLSDMKRYGPEYALKKKY
jgi:hypothetical protein